MDVTCGHRKIEESLRAELKAAQDVLAMQQQECYRFQEHVQIIEAELDSVQDLLKQKQLKINELSNIILEKDDKISNLNALLDENRVDRHALKGFETQNLSLFTKIKEKAKSVEELEIELRFLKENFDDKSDYNDDRAKRVAAQDIILTSTLNSMQKDLATANNTIAQRDEEIALLKQQMASLRAAAWLSEEHRRDEVARSRQSEYRTLAKLQQVQDEYFRSNDANELLLDTVQLKTKRGNMLQRQLNRTVDTLEESQDLFGRVVDQVETRSAFTRANEHQLLRENQNLQAQIQMLQLALQQLRTPQPRQPTLADTFDFASSPYAERLYTGPLPSSSNTNASARRDRKYSQQTDGANHEAVSNGVNIHTSGRKAASSQSSPAKQRQGKVVISKTVGALPEVRSPSTSARPRTSAAASGLHRSPSKSKATARKSGEGKALTVQLPATSSAASVLSLGSDNGSTTAGAADTSALANAPLSPAQLATGRSFADTIILEEQKDQMLRLRMLENYLRLWVLHHKYRSIVTAAAGSDGKIEAEYNADDDYRRLCSSSNGSEYQVAAGASQVDAGLKETSAAKLEIERFVGELHLQSSLINDDDVNQVIAININILHSNAVS